jgi:hypothetical protein
MKTNKKLPALPKDWFWKLLAIVGVAASIASLIVSLVK